MADQASGGARWIKYGCLGCVGLVVIVALMIGAVAGIAFLGGEEPDPQDQVRTHEVERPDAAVDTATEILPARPGKVTLDIATAECEIEPADPGEPLRVEASYDANAFALDETFSDPEGEPWSYSLTFRNKSAGFIATLREMFSSGGPEIHVFLPPDVPFALEMDTSQGGCVVRLGGLWLTEAVLRGNIGGLIVNFDEPTREPLESLDIDVSMAGVQLHDLGNASPRRLTVDVRMAGMNLDLGGAWRNDCDITVGLRQGGGMMRLPRDVAIEGLDAKGIQSGADPEIPQPVLRFSPRSRLDDIDVRR